MIAAFAMAAAFLLDAAFGEPRRAHPLVAFGRVAARIERAFHAPTRLAGALAWVLAVVPAVASAWLASRAAAAMSVALDAAFGAVMLYLALGLRSLGEHARAVADALARDDLVEARVALARIVSRDTAALDGGQIAAAATESVLENGNDAVFGALFWFAVLGVPGAVLYRLANTLDAMWGYRTPRYDRFGWAAARIDDGLNYVPARLTALTYALFGDGRRALRCWRTQARRWKSPNAGPVMAAGAGALGVRLGGAARYHGVWQQRPALGEGADADGAAIERALQLVWRGAVLWVVVVPLVAALVRLGHAHA